MITRDDRYGTASYRYRPVDQAFNVAAKRQVRATLHRLTSTPTADLGAALRDGYHEDATVNVTHPVNALLGIEAAQAAFWQPLRRALPDVERRDDIVAAGLYRDEHLVGCLGHYVGTFAQDWLGIPATRGVVSVRFAEGHIVRDGKIATSYLFIDFLDLMRQARFWPLPPSLGREMRWLPPHSRDGVILAPQDNAVSEATIWRVLRMHAALGYFSGGAPTREKLDEMQMARHWHPNFMWYGPAGIGTTRGLKGFEDYHQIPFLVAFPDRSGSEVGHFIRIGDGRYAVTGGWGYLRATHTGPEFLGLPATGREVRMRVMDFYCCNDDTIVENWVPIDIPHLLLQLGVDLFGRMHHQFRQHNPASASEWLVPDTKRPDR